MASLSQERREKMLAFLETLKEQHSDDESLIALGEIERELKAKKYGLVWEEHEEEVDVKMRTHIPGFTADDSKEINADTTTGSYNFLLEGDNLHSLRLLEKTHHGNIDVIYIDPPYNTQNKDFVYDDNLIGMDDGFRHSKWLSFMSIRLRIANKLLSNRGVIFISIDDNEVSQLKLLCDDLFGEGNFVTQLVWEKKKKGSFLSNQITNIKEYVLVYCKNKAEFSGLIGEVNAKTETYPCINASNKRAVCKVAKGIKSNYKEKNYRVPAGTVISDSTMNIKYITDLVIENGVVVEDFEVEGNWRYSADAMHEYSSKGELYITNALYIRRIVSEPRLKTMKDLLPRVGSDDTVAYNTPIDTDNLFDSGWGSNEDADNEIIDLFGKQRIFSYPKPIRLIKKLICSTRIKDAIVLDFFAGSGTTGQAVLELNKQDGGNRKFILCTNNENGICENVTYQRLKTVITGKRADNSEYSEGIPSNLMYFSTDFVDKESDELSDELLAHIREMIQLEHGIKIDDRKYVVILTEEEMDEFEENIANYPDLKAVFINSDIFLSAKQQKMLNEVDSYVIPDYYFDFELREAGEIW